MVLAFCDESIGSKAIGESVSAPNTSSRQWQDLCNLAAEYDREPRQILQVGELVKGSVPQRPGVSASACSSDATDCAAAFMKAMRGLHRRAGLRVVANKPHQYRLA